MRSKVDLKDLSLFAMESVPISQAIQSDIAGSIPSSLGRSLTLLIILRHDFVMAPPQLRPLGELILRTRGVHLPLQAHHLPSKLDLRFGISRRRGRKFVVKVP